MVSATSRSLLAHLQHIVKSPIAAIKTSVRNYYSIAASAFVARAQRFRLRVFLGVNKPAVDVRQFGTVFALQARSVNSMPNFASHCQG